MPEFLGYLKKTLPQLQHHVLERASEVVRSHVHSVRRWTTQASTGELSLTDVRWLISSQMDLTGMNTLRDAGLSLVRIDEVRQAFVNSLVSSIFKINILK